VAPAAVTLALSLLFAGAALLADRLPGRWSAAPVLALALLAHLLFVELARHDHGHGEVLVQLGWVLAPLVVIFAGALWGTRRFYGWPDAGPNAGRAAVVAGGVVLGVLVGRSYALADAMESQRRAEAIRAEILAWRDAHGGRWPETLAPAVPRPPRSRMGVLDPPAFEYRATAAGATLRFPLSGGLHRVLDLAGGGWGTEGGR
jgi:hypothetical protein